MKTSEIIRRIKVENAYRTLNCDISQEFIDAISRSFLGNKDIYTDVDQLRRYLEENKVPIVDIGRFVLIVSVEGFPNLITGTPNNCVDKAALDAFVVKAYEQTGLLKFLILEYLSVVFTSKGLQYQLSFTDKDIDLASIDHSGTAFYFPYDSYKALLDNDDITPESYDGLISLGVPMAYYLKGKSQMSVAKVDSSAKDNNEEAIKNIRTAAILGYDAAAVEMGRYYFDQGIAYWEKAFDYYSSCGIGILSEQDRENIISLINFRRYNKINLVYGAIAWVITFLLVCLVPSFSYYTGQRFYGIITLIIQGVILFGGLLFHRKMPHTSTVKVFFYIFALLMSFVIVRLLF